ncbi:peptide deformylase [uncultured Mitsuokella sp.]|uniref:peptide deformylase n=1 Tax=uncultured Mitsuokella sp. TaxID=453120 RepID=UPI00266E9E1D|nr:peptide deformylase [uncultured Mitsuokella sp.]
MVRDIMHDTFFLQQKSIPATPFDKAVAMDLLDTLQAHADSCVGMAANMIGVAKCIIAVNVGPVNMVMFNPKIVKQKGPYTTKEGCLSLTGEREAQRYREIEVEFQDMDFRKKKMKFKAFPAQIIQHEVDHLQGILI